MNMTEFNPGTVRRRQQASVHIATHPNASESILSKGSDGIAGSRRAVSFGPNPESVREHSRFCNHTDRPLTLDSVADATGLDNVRTCCEGEEIVPIDALLPNIASGRHDVGSLDRRIKFR